MSHFRRTVVFRNNDWVEIDFMELKKGDNFRMFEQNGEEVFDEYGSYVMCATSDPYYDIDFECWMVDTD